MARKRTPAGDPSFPPIHTVRGEAVATGQFNRAIKRHAFRLTAAERETLRCRIGTLKTDRDIIETRLPFLNAPVEPEPPKRRTGFRPSSTNP